MVALFWRIKTMREILFKGKRKDNGEWVEGYYLHISEGEGTHDFEQHFIKTEYKGRFGLCYEVIPETIGQYTGLCDRNGKKIFEGDIVNFSDILYYIIFVDGCFRICRNHQFSYTLHNLHSSFEVIGNIHDNPELLKGGD
jgi:hypothetical protein